MAKSNAVWGIDVGQCALKALRCIPHDDDDKITADAFDFIEYPKILSQPEADPVELIRDALKQFLSRNKVRDDKVAICVPGQAGLARFIKLPPVEQKKIPDIVRYEARQQIPFALEDVVFDWQQMAGGSESDGFALETEVGLFAMKRDQVYRALKPFTDAGIEVDMVQLTPLSLYNFVVFDQMRDLPSVDSYDPKDPPPSTIVVSLGTDTTDLVITNGYRVWQRNIPLGGNHFTKALTKELKLTFAKAEHLKRNALKAEDPKAVFLAMRPVFNDLVSEVQRSIAFFQSVDRTAKIGRVITLGNAMKLRGLQKYLGQTLGYEVVELNEYRGLAGSSVVGTPAFKDNLLSFGVCYGLTLQGLKRSALRTNLIPPEIIQDRLVKAKKPWAVATVAALLLGCTLGYVGWFFSWKSAEKTPVWIQDMDKAAQAKQKAEGWATDFAAKKTSFAQVQEIGNRLLSVGERRLLWPDLIRAVSQCLPQDPTNPTVPGFINRNAAQLKPDEAAANIQKSLRLEIDSVDCEYYSRLEDWFADVKDKWVEGQPEGTAASASAAPPAPAASGPAPAAADAGVPWSNNSPSGPTGPGWVIELKGHHYHNLDRNSSGAQYVRMTLLKDLEAKLIVLPTPDGKGTVKVPISELGIGYPTLVKSFRLEQEDIPLPIAAAAPAAGGGPAGAAPANVATVTRYNFWVQFCWKEIPWSKRLEKPKPPDGQAPAVASMPPASH